MQNNTLFIKSDFNYMFVAIPCHWYSDIWNNLNYPLQKSVNLMGTPEHLNR